MNLIDKMNLTEDCGTSLRLNFISGAYLVLPSHHQLSVVDDVHREDEGAEGGVGDDGVLALGQEDQEEACQHEDDEEAAQHACCGGHFRYLYVLHQVFGYMDVYWMYGTAGDLYNRCVCMCRVE